MKLAAEAHAHIERFLRFHLGDKSLQLPPMSIYCGHFAGWLTQIFCIGAITFRRHILVAPVFIRRGDDGRRTIPGWLIVHEAIHVLQYEKEGMARFFLSYWRGYWRALRQSERWNAATHLAAYHAIAEERVAREAEEAYRGWIETMSQRLAGDEKENAFKHRAVVDISTDKLSLDSTQYSSNI